MSPRRIFSVFLLLIIAAVLPATILAGCYSWASIEKERALWDKELLGTVRNVDADIDDEMATQVDLAKTLAVSPVLDDVQDVTTIDRWVDRLKGIHHQWLSVNLFDKRLRLVYQTPKMDSNMPIEMDSLVEVFTKKDVVIGKITQGPHGKWGIPVRAPVVRNGTIVAVLTIVVDPLALSSDLITHGKDLPGSVIVVSDKDGIVVARSLSPETSIGQSLSDPALEARKHGPLGVYSGITLEGVKTKAAFIESHLSGWTVHVSMSETVYNEKLDGFKFTAAAGGVGATIITVLFIVVLNREIQKRQRETVLLNQKMRMESLGHLTGRVAHDFNNLLFIISANLSMIEDKLPQSRAMTAMRTGVDRATKMTTGLLAFSKGAIEQTEKVLLNEHLKEAVTSMQASVPEDVSVKFDLTESLPEIEIDLVQLDVALLNLIINACDAMPDGGTITIGTHTSYSRGHWVCLRVRDTGMGIPRANLTRVFDPFFTTKEKGTGFGLSQVYGFVTNSGGKLDVESDDQGTSITLMFPAASGYTHPAVAA